MDFEKDILVFEDYIKQNYDLNNGLILEKYIHTLMVVRVMINLCQKMSLNEEDTQLAIYMALFHDLGRFKEVVRQNEFNNLKFDHGSYSNKILFNDEFIKEFPINEEDYLIIRKAIYYHNKKDLGNDLTEREEFFSKLLRDADRIDIFRVLSYNDNLFDGVSSSDILSDFYNGISMSLKKIKTKGDKVVLRFGFVKIFSFKESFEVLRETGYFQKYVNSINVLEHEQELFNELCEEINVILEGEKNYVRKKV